MGCKGSFICYATPLGGGGPLIYYEALLKKQGGGVYKVPLGIARGFSGQTLSAMNKRVFSLCASSPSGKPIYQSLHANSCTFFYQNA